MQMNDNLLSPFALVVDGYRTGRLEGSDGGRLTRRKSQTKIVEMSPRVKGGEVEMSLRVKGGKVKMWQSITDRTLLTGRILLSFVFRPLLRGDLHTVRSAIPRI